MTTPESESRRETLIAYVRARDEERAEAVALMSARLTERERLLVKEAAVMGWVQGMRHHDVDLPGDGDITRIVLDAARAFDDLYPTLAGLQGPGVT